MNWIACEFCGQPATLSLDGVVHYCDVCRHLYWRNIVALCDQRNAAQQIVQADADPEPADQSSSNTVAPVGGAA